MNYQDLIDSCFSNLTVAEDLPLLVDELELQSHWFSGHFGTRFTTTEGQLVEVKQLGFWNRTAGPDFLHCAVEIDGVLHSGPIELDLSSHHWEQHGHSSNPNFDKVILHVIFEQDAKPTFTRTSSNRHIPKVVVDRATVMRGLNLQTHTQATSHLGRCSTPLSECSNDSIGTLLEMAARHRIALKNTRARQNSQLHGVAQTLWMQIAETLGYRANSMAFKVLAQRIPIQVLTSYSEQEIQAILFGAAGFLHPTLHQSAPEDSQEWLESLWQTWWQHRQKFEFDDSRKIQWKLSGSRPVNHPQRRLAALCQVAIHWHRIRKCKSIEELNEILLEMTDPFWNFHYTLTSKKSNKFLKLIGQDRINDLFLNHILPGKISSEETKGETQCSYWQLYQSYKAPVVSERVNRAANRLLGAHPNKQSFLKKSWHHQALLQLYQDFCLNDTSNCEDCPFPEQLKHWS